MIRLTTIASLFIVAACGGAATGDAKAPGADGERKPEKHETIGAIVAEQGGLAALGGAGNREQGTGTEVAMTGPLRAETLSHKNPPKLDGMVKEWHARAPAKETISGKTDALGLDVAIQSGDDTLWIAAEVVDPKLTRSAAHGMAEDHVTLTIAFPSGRGALKAYEIGLWPGTPGSTPGAVKWTAGPNTGQVVAGAKLVENDVKGGVTLEATVPWASFPDAVRVGMRAAFRYHDGDGSSVTGVLATGTGSFEKPTELPALPIPAEQAVVEGLLEQKGLAGTKPNIDVYADVSGDDRKERISVFGRFFTICGPGYRKGRQFFWRELAGDIVSLENKELTGHGKDELVIRRRVTLQSGASHEILEVWSIPTGGEEPSTIFAHEIAMASKDGKQRLSNAARLSSKEIEVSTEPATGWDAASFNEPIAGDVEPLLLPWGAIKSRTFKLEKGKFAKASEVASGLSQSSSPSAQVKLPNEQPSRDVPTPTVHKGSDLGKLVLDAYLKDAGLTSGTKPRFDLEVNVDGDPKPERVVLYGRDIVVLGPSFKGGTGYARLSLTQFSEDKDITELTARDLNGNGAAELIVRGARHAKSPTGETIDIDGLFVYEVKAGTVTRVFAIETGREMAGKRVQGLVQFVPAKGGNRFEIDARPGAAKGWTKETYPWPQDKPGAGTVEPLLLPWGNVPNVRYTWNGTQFAAP